MVRAYVAYALLAIGLTTSVAAASDGRHLKYAFSIYSLASTTTHLGSSLSGPGTGTMDVDFPGSGPHGGMLVEAREWWWQEPRPEQPVTCELLVDGSLSCEQLPLPTMAEVVLFPMLSPKYFDGIGTAKWRVGYTVTPPANYYKLSTVVDLSLRSWSGSVADIQSDGTTRPVGGPLIRQFEHGT